MRRLRVVAGGGLIAGLLAAVAFAPPATSKMPPAVRHEVIAVYLGTRGTDERSGMVQTNSEIVRYIGGRFDSTQASSIPQVVLLERDVTEGGPSSLTVSPEREIARYIGIQEIGAWVRRGAPLP
jgi:hypothetical protein